MRLLLTIATSISLLAASATLMAQKNTPAKQARIDLSKALLDKELWKTPISKFYLQHRDYKFKWQTASQKSLRSEGKHINLFGIKTGEIIIKSNKKRVKSATISLYNKGDNKPISQQEFTNMATNMAAKLTEKLGTKPKQMSKNKAISMQRQIWQWNDSAFLLESSITGRKAEFLRVRVTSMRTARNGSKTANRSGLKSNLVFDKETGDVYIDNIPMIDQGQKGYCACASAARIYQYYGLTLGQHEVAKMAGSSAAGGTSISKMVTALKKASTKLDSRVLILYEYPKNITEESISYKKWQTGMKDTVRDINSYQKLAKKNKAPSFRIQGKKEYSRLPSNEEINFFSFYNQCDAKTFRSVMIKKSSFKRWQSKIKEYIDKGIPVGWCLQLGKFKEPNLPQISGGHMRLIIGYNQRNNEIIYSDSWGAGHAKKKMDAGNAFTMTNVTLVLPPKK